MRVVVGIAIAIPRNSSYQGFMASGERKSMSTTKRTGWLMAGLLMLALSLTGSSWAPSNGPIAQLDVVSLDDDADGVEKNIILNTVRRYRPTAEDSWRSVLAEAVHREAAAAGMDPLLITAMVAKESSFQSRVVSRAGAVGLMQMRPFVAQDVATRRHEASVEWLGVETLHQPDSNVRLGILYYQELVDRFDGDLATALEAYNRGPSRVGRELREGSVSSSGYADRVLGLYRELDAQRASS
jgi:soluble lytic murein transglycosylase